MLVVLCLAVPAHARAKMPVEPPKPPVDTLRTEVLRSAGEALLGEDAPWIAGWTISGDVWNVKRALADSTCDRVAMVFFATWCAPCRHGIALLKERAADLQRNRVQVVLVNFREDAETVRAYLGPEPPFTVMLDRYGNCRQAYLRGLGDSVVLPQTVVVGRNGRIQMIIGKEGADYVDRILAGS